MKIDNFALTMHQTCPAKFDLRIQQNWSTRKRSGALGFGGCFHEGLKRWYRGEGLDAALGAIEETWPQEMPVDDWRTKTKCLVTMEQYAKAYPHEPFTVLGIESGNPMVEVSFTLDTGLHLSCFKCGPMAARLDVEGIECCAQCLEPLEPIEYGGIFDTLVNASGQIYVLEHKSTSVLGAYYFQQFKPNNQITGYTWAGSELTGKPVRGAIINAIGVYKSQATKFERSPTTRNAADISQWLRDVQAVCEEIQQHRRTGYFPRRTAACQLYGSCEFHSVHVLSSETEQLKRLQNDYIREEWNYETRDEPSSSTGT